MITVLLADGFEEIEALTPVDMLRRAGLDVKTVGITSKIAVGSHGISVVCDLNPDEVPLKEVTMAIFPGGMPGSLNLDASPFTDKIIGAVLENGGRLAAICAAPLVLGRRGLLEGKRATCYPGFENELKGAVCVNDGVVTDGAITTAKGMGVSLAFAEELISLVCGESKAKELSEAIMEVKPDAPEENAEGAEGSTEQDSDYTKDDALADLARFFDDFKSTDDEDSPGEPAELDNSDAGCSSGAVRTPDFIGAPALENGYSLDTGALLKDYAPAEDIDAQLEKIVNELVDAYAELGVKCTVTGKSAGPTLATVTLAPPAGRKTRTLTKYIDDIQLALCVWSIRAIEVPMQNRVRFEIPLHKPSLVGLKELLSSEEMSSSAKPTLVPFGVTSDNKDAFVELSRTPHLLVSGATGMGKSVFLNGLITSLAAKNSPEQVRLLLIDPKKVEFTSFSALPHLLCPIITDSIEAAAALTLMCDEIDRRYSVLEKKCCRNIESYNEAVGKDSSFGEVMPRIFVVIDELADLMMQVRDPIENLIMRIAQKARAAGIHIMIGTQRPTTDVITGVIKANIPTRVCFKVASLADSRVVLDQGGANCLLGRGDMLCKTAWSTELTRIQAPFVSDSEVNAVASASGKDYPEGLYSDFVISEIKRITAKLRADRAPKNQDEDEWNPLLDSRFLDALELVKSERNASTSFLQRKLSIGYGKAARYLDAMCEMGIISEPQGAKPRAVLMTSEQIDEMLNERSAKSKSDLSEEDERFIEAMRLAVSTGHISTSLLQRKLYIGYGKAAKYLDMMEELGVVGEYNGTKPREVLISAKELEDKLERLYGED